MSLAILCPRIWLTYQENALANRVALPWLNNGIKFSIIFPDADEISDEGPSEPEWRRGGPVEAPFCHIQKTLKQDNVVGVIKQFKTDLKFVFEFLFCNFAKNWNRKLLDNITVHFILERCLN